MGWWSNEHIMGGDPSFDCLANIAKVMEAKFIDTKKPNTKELFWSYRFKKEKIIKNLPSLMKQIESPRWYDKTVSCQVLAQIILFYGIEVDSKTKTKLIREIKKDTWDHPNHKKVVKNLITKIKNYTEGRWKEDPESKDGYERIDSNSVSFLKTLN
jgi:hypothetical protein